MGSYVYCRYMALGGRKWPPVTERIGSRKTLAGPALVVVSAYPTGLPVIKGVRLTTPSGGINQKKNVIVSDRHCFQYTFGKKNFKIANRSLRRSIRFLYLLYDPAIVRTVQHLVYNIWQMAYEFCTESSLCVAFALCSARTRSISRCALTRSRRTALSIDDSSVLSASFLTNDRNADCRTPETKNGDLGITVLDMCIVPIKVSPKSKILYHLWYCVCAFTKELLFLAEKVDSYWVMDMYVMVFALDKTNAWHLQLNKWLICFWRRSFMVKQSVVIYCSSGYSE